MITTHTYRSREVYYNVWLENYKEAKEDEVLKIFKAIVVVYGTESLDICMHTFLSLSWHMIMCSGQAT